MSMNRADAYYEPEDDIDGDEINERIDYELKNNNYPYSAVNIRDAFCDDGFEGHWETLAGLLRVGNTAQAGVVLSSILYTYWEDRSTREVLENF